MDDSIRLYYYNGEWQPYQTLHDEHGITLTPSTPITVYDNSLNGYPAWVEQDTDNVWVVADQQWYTYDTLPYWVKLDTKYRVYLIDNPMYLDTYRLRTTEMYEYNGSLQNFDYMHNGYGITTTPSQVYLVQDGMIKCWYNQDILDLPYWDVDSRRWVATPPHSGSSGGINDIGSTGMFLFTNTSGTPVHYGTFIQGSQLQPICLNFPYSGELSCTKFSSVEITGTWRLLTETSVTSPTKPCVVFAIKVSESSNTSGTNSSSNSLGTHNSTDLFDI